MIRKIEEDEILGCAALLVLECAAFAAKRSCRKYGVLHVLQCAFNAAVHICMCCYYWSALLVLICVGII